MGCCFSTKAKRHPQPQNDAPKPQPQDRAPPPSVELECVKEVLSETHKTTPVVPEEKIETEEVLEKTEEEVVMEVVVEVSQVSEMCSVSEPEVSHSQVSELSFSTATTLRDCDEVASKPRADPAQRVGRSPAKVPRKRVYSGELAGGNGRFPARRVDPSPEKKGQAAARSARGTTQSRLRQQNGETSARRSRSPATRAANGASRGKSPVKQQTGRPGGGSRNGQSKEEARNGTVVERKIEDESIDNPHVSLECFIFL